MARTKKFDLPKYLRLGKGLMWMDIEGENCSNVSLCRSTDVLVGRGNDIKKFAVKGINEKTKKDEREYKSDIYPEYKPIEKKTSFPAARDKNKNEVSEHGEYGHKELEDKSWFCTSNVPPENLSKILTAYQNGILIKHDPKKEYVTAEESKQKKDFIIQPDGDIIFDGKNTHMYNMLNNRKITEVIDYVIGAGLSNRQNLMDLYQYELKGYNHISRPRAELLDVIILRLRELGPGISAITTNDLDDEE